MKQTMLSSIEERLARAEAAPCRQFALAGHDFVLLPKVFPPSHFQSTKIFTEHLEYVPGTSFLEIGCGAGATATVAALRGCTRVVATDISVDAVENARMNAALHGVTNIVSVRHGDLFDVLAPDERFDVIFWNSNFVYVADESELRVPQLRAFCDPGYASHERFLAEAPNYLSQRGKILLGFSSQGDDTALTGLLARHNYQRETLHSSYGVGPNPHRYDIVLLQPPARR